MMVNSPLEIYGAVFGVEIYDDFFNILYSFGFVYLPFVFILYSAIKALFENPYGYRVALGRAYWQFGGWVVGMMIAVIPVYPLNVDSITYQPVCTTDATLSTFGNTGTTYDQVLGNQSFPEIRVSVLMGVFLEAFSGVTNAGISSLSCNINVPDIQGTIDTTRLNPQLAQSVQRFQNECWSKAAAEMNNQNPDPSTYQSIENNYGGPSDLGWVGSHVYQTLYYSNIYPTTPVPGFPYNNFPYPYQSYNSQNGDNQTPQWGFPTCEQWWSDPVYGIEGQLVKSVQNHQPTNSHLGNESITNEVGTWLQEINSGFNVGSQVDSDDAIAYSLLYDKGSESAFSNNGFSNYIDDNGMSNGNDVNDILKTAWFGHELSQGAADVGQAYGMIDSSTQRVEIQHEVEIMQAVLLALLISVGPIVMLAGNLRVSVILTYYFLLGSIIFAAFLEYFIHTLEMSIVQSTGMSNSLSGLTTEYPYIYNIFTKIYQYAPFIYLMIMSWCGVAAGSGVHSFMQDNSAVKTAGAGFAKTAGTVAKFL